VGKAPAAIPRTHLEAVVIGASAGGVEALRAMLARLPAGFRPAILAVIHLPAARESLLVEVLGRHCPLPLQEACDKEPIRSGTVYVAPAGYHLLVERDRSLALSVDAPVNYSRPSIDVLFESAAHAYRERLLGIVLTGANEDGARGLAAIRAYGGAAWVQDPASAMASAMPAGAIARAGADRILDLQEMAAALAAL
jgi:two-component system, chemotaxis family, protein-glutamate methylesterase/glutaminase